MEDQSDDDNVHSVGDDNHEAEPAEEVAWAFHDLQETGRRGMPALQAIRDLCTKCKVKEPSDLTGTQAIIEDGIFYISRFTELTNKLAERKEICLTHRNKHKTEIAWLNDLASERIL